MSIIVSDIPVISVIMSLSRVLFLLSINYPSIPNCIPVINVNLLPKNDIYILKHHKESKHSIAKEHKERTKTKHFKLSCDKCDFVAKAAFYLRRHTESYHAGHSYVIQKETFACNVCFKHFPDRGVLAVHKWIHIEPKDTKEQEDGPLLIKKDPLEVTMPPIKTEMMSVESDIEADTIIKTESTD